MADKPPTLPAQAETIRLQGFLNRIKAFREESEKSKEGNLLFLLGSGASRDSGIKTGGEMVRDWIEQLRLDIGGDEHLSLEQWATAERLGIPGFDPNDWAASYPQVYKRCFDGCPQAGFDYLEDEIARCRPSYGYTVVAQILGKTRHKTVVTTNFDNLVAEALMLYINTSPIMCSHESLAGFIRIKSSRPQVIKVHRDLFLGPMNTHEDMTNNLDGKLEEALDNVFKNHAPVVVGYGGNDGTLMGLLEKLKPGTFCRGFYWCHMKGTSPSGRIQSLVAKHHGRLVPISGFSALMLQLQNALGLEPLEDILEASTRKLLSDHREQHEKLLELVQEQSLAAATSTTTATTSTAPGDLAVPKPSQEEPEPNLEDSWRSILKRKSSPLSSWDWHALAQMAPKKEEKESIYQQGLQALPNDAWMHGYYATYLRAIGETTRAESEYRRSTELGPTDAMLLSNYALFLTEVCEKNELAEDVYLRALEQDPKVAGILGNYANFLTSVRHDHDRAEEFYKRALVQDPKHVKTLGNYASFLTRIRGEHDRAEKLYRRALDQDPRNALILDSYAGFMTDVCGQHDYADWLYKQALATNPSEANILGNYARLLLATGRFDEGLAKVDESLRFQDGRSPKELPAECQMYLVCCAPPERRGAALGELKKLVVEKGIRTGNWSFKGVIERAVAMKHPDAEWLPKLAEVLAGKAEPATLDSWPAWREA